MCMNAMKDKSFEIIPCSEIADIENGSKFKKMNLTSSQKIQMGGLLQQIPSLVAARTLSDMYMVRFPTGIPNALMPLKQGGFSTMVKGENGKIVGMASLYSAEQQAAVLGAFTAMSIVSGQYFLAQINSEMKTMNLNIDKILEFLYGDKKAELMAEVTFVKSAYQNYRSIMEHEQQRLATIISLQASRKVAVKDIEFYMSDLESVVSAKNVSNIAKTMGQAFQIKDCLELSIQLYSMSSLLEMYYSQNYDTDYICYVENEVALYVGKCEKWMLSGFSKLSAYIQNYKENLIKKIDKSALEQRVSSVINSYNTGTESELLRSIRSALHAPEAAAEYYMDKNGELYLKTA